MLYFLYFFRNPSRQIVRDETAILSPADGTVQEVAELAHDPDEFVAGKSLPAFFGALSRVAEGLLRVQEM